MNRTTLLFQVFWRDARLRRDLDVLMANGHVQREAREHDSDTPSGWFRFAARAYPDTHPHDYEAKLARACCLCAALLLAEDAPS
jgi:hypothetical protein